MSETRKIRVLLVDDSASVRTTLSEIIAADPDLEVRATAADPYWIEINDADSEP